MTSPNHLQSCTDSDQGRQHESAEQVALAIALCNERRVRLTTTRRQLLELLWESDRPTGAYALIEGLKLRNARPVNPPTVYRALDFLMSQGFVSRIESRNAYVPCAHPERHHDGIFFICDNCGASVELEDRRIGQLLAEDASNRLGFRVSQRVVEVEGTCRNCIAAELK